MKNRKLFAALLSLVLAVMIPMTSLAATAVDISVMPGDALLSQMPEEMRPAMVDLFNALTIRVLSGEKSGMLSILLSGTSALDVAFRADENGLFVQSEVLGDKPLYFEKNDLADFMVNMLKEQGQAMSAEEEQELRENFNVMFSGAGAATMPTAFDVEAAEGPVEFVFDKDAAIEGVSQMYANDPAMVTYTTNMINRAVVTEGEFVSENRDAANVSLTMTMTSEDFIVLLDSASMQTSIAQLAAENNVSEEEAKAQMKAQFEKMDMNLVMTFYIVKEDSSFVGMDMTMSMKEDKNDPETDTMDMTMTLDRLTTDVVTYTFNMKAYEDGELEAGADFVVIDNQNDVIDLDGKLYEYADADAVKDVVLMKGNFTTTNDILYGWFGIVDVEQQQGVTFALASQPTNDGNTVTVDLYIRENAAAPIAPVASDAPAFTIKVDVSENVSEEALAAVDAATVDGSLQILRMNETELNDYVKLISDKATSLVFSLFSLLPPSVLQLFMSMGM